MYIDIDICVCKYIYTYIYLYIYIHTYLYIYSYMCTHHQIHTQISCTNTLYPEPVYPSRVRRGHSASLTASIYPYIYVLVLVNSFLFPSLPFRNVNPEPAPDYEIAPGGDSYAS